MDEDLFDEEDEEEASLEETNLESMVAEEGSKALQLTQNPELTNVDVSDEKFSTYRSFSSLTGKEKPLYPLPPDESADVYYPQFLHKGCQICRSEYRTLAEHVYIDSGKRAMEVTRFFARYFGAKIWYSPVQTHMEHHCDLGKIGISGLKNYDMRDDELAKYKYNLYDTLVTALLCELDDVRGMNCAKNNDLKLKRAVTVERLAGKLWTLKKEREEAGTMAVDIFSILANLINRMKHEEDKRIILDLAKELREALAASGKTV